MAGLVEPLRVSPFIKFCRWGMLFTGIFYGATRYKALSRKQTAIRDEFERTRPEREAANKILRENQIAAELKMLSEATGSKIG